MRRFLAVFLLLALIPLPAIAAGGSKRFSVEPGEAVFWSGPFSKDGSGGPWVYRLDVAEGGYRLRIGIDRPEIGDVFTASIADPSGSSVGSISPGTDLYSDEFLAINPIPGTWRIEVRAGDVTDSAFRMRAKLEARKPSLGKKRGPVLPNLQILPPHEASFLTPVSNGSTSGEPMSLDTGGAESCHPEEHAENRAIRCLRFAFGIRNTGLGPLDLFASGPIVMDQKLTQRIQLAQGGSIEREAGVARFHKTHGHSHHHDAVALQLFKVTQRKKGTMEEASGKHFKGFAHRDELLRDWEHFYPTWDKAGFGLLAGWADIYEWDRPGNYIDFGLNGDGYYVVRMWADPVRGILESNERDNTGYTYLKITGDEVELLEAGRGSDPWDPCKIEVGFGGHPDPDRGARPRSCPPDTT